MRARSALLVTALFAPAAAWASAGGNDFELRCEREMKPVLEVRLAAPAFDVDNAVSSRVLHTRERHATVGQLALGLTAGTILTEISFDAPALVDRGAARECAAPHLSVALRYNPLRVFVAREFSPYSCSFRTVYAHEMQHVEVYRTQMPLVERMVREALARRYGNGPLYAPAGGAIAQLETDVDTWLRPLIRQALARVEAMQEAIDSPEESFRLSHACHGEVASLLGNS